MPRKVLTAAAPEPNQDTAIQVEVTLPLRQRCGEGGKAPKDQTRRTSDRPRVPRITRLMALAIKFQSMVDEGEVDDYADLARLPSAKDVFEYRRGFARLLDLPFGRQEVTINIGSAAALYKKLVTTTEGYAGDVPIIHQAVAVKAAIDAMDTAFAEDRDASF